jgi:hypothetical protein
MQLNQRWLAVILLLTALSLVACGQSTGVTAAKDKPAKVEKIEGTELSRVVLTEKAAQRLEIQTAPVRAEQLNGAQRTVMPYAALIYDLKGQTWAYTAPAALTFVRQAITVDYIEGDRVIFTDGPPAGTEVVIVGVAELYGTETGIGK